MIGATSTGRTLGLVLQDLAHGSVSQTTRPAGALHRDGLCSALLRVVYVPWPPLGFHSYASACPSSPSLGPLLSNTYIETVSPQTVAHIHHLSTTPRGFLSRQSRRERPGVNESAEVIAPFTHST